MILVIVVGIILALGTVAIIVTPLLRPPRAQPAQTLTVSAELLARRDRIYGELRELEFDSRVGKVTSDEYSEARERLESDAARVLRAIDLEVKTINDVIEREVGALRTSGEACAACGTPISPDARFCPVCGVPTTVTARS